MAEEDLSLEEPKEESEEGEAKGGNKKLLIIGGAVALVLIIGGAVAFFMMGDDAAEGDAAVATPEVVEVIDEKGDAIYVSIHEPFLVNVKAGNRTRMMQIKVQFMVRSEKAEEAVMLHMPLIRNNMLDYFSLADAEEVRTREGRNALKDGALKTAQKVLKDQAGFEAIEMVLFTGFVVQ